MKEASRDKSHYNKTPEHVNPTWETCTDLTDIADYIGSADPDQVAQALLKRSIRVRREYSEECRGK